jgi:hypothetical protein
MKKFFHKLWNDEGGFILSTEAMILWTITVLGLIVGLVAVRDATVTELTEVANTILTFDQSYQYEGILLANQPGTTAAIVLTTGSSAQDNPGTSSISNTVYSPYSLTAVNAKTTVIDKSGQNGAFSINVAVP